VRGDERSDDEPQESRRGLGGPRSSWLRTLTTLQTGGWDLGARKIAKHIMDLGAQGPLPHRLKYNLFVCLL
jgi:hypothetical protein